MSKYLYVARMHWNGCIDPHVVPLHVRGETEWHWEVEEVGERRCTSSVYAVSKEAEEELLWETPTEAAEHLLIRLESLTERCSKELAILKTGLNRLKGLCV